MSNIEQLAKKLKLDAQEIKAATLVFERDVLPPGKRKTYEDIAHELGISTRTLYNIRNDERVIEYINALSSQYERQARTRVMASVIAEAERGSAAHAKLYMQSAGLLVNTKVSIIEDTTSAIDKDKVAAKLAELQSKL